MNSILGLGRYTGEENGNPLQYSCLGNPIEREETGGLQSVGLQKSQIGHKDRMTTRGWKVREMGNDCIIGNLGGCLIKIYWN